MRKEKHASSVRHLLAILKRSAERNEISHASFRSAVSEGGEATLKCLMKLLFGATKNVTKEDLLSSIERFRSLYSDDEHSTDLRLPQATPLSHYAEAFDVSCRPESKMNAQSFMTFFNDEFSEELFRYLTRRGASLGHVSTSFKELVKRFHVERSWRRNVEKYCDAMLGGKEFILVEDLRQMLGLESFFASRVFSFFDKNGSGHLGREELCLCLLKLTSSCREEKLRFVFSLYDANGDGALDKAELENALRSCSLESKLDLNDDTVKQLTDALFSSIAGREKFMKFDDTLRMLATYPSIYSGLSISFPAVTLKRPQSQQQNIGCLNRPLKHFKTYPTLWVTCIVYLAVNATIFGFRLKELLDSYPGSTKIPFIIAKCAGRLLNFNAAITLVFTMKHIISRMRRMARLRRLLPLDDAMSLHKVVAYVIMTLSGIHIAAHTGNIVVNINYNHYEDNYFLDGPTNMMIFVSGVLLTFLLLVVMVMSYQKIVRKSYELFYWSHSLLYVSFYVATIIHASTFWMWFIAPAVLFGLEKAVSCMMLLRSRSEVTVGRLMPSEVVYLEINRPAGNGTKLTHGDYVKVNIPSISRLEWHPFTISSSSKNGARIGLHIRAVGKWTKRLQEAVLRAAWSERQGEACMSNATSVSFVSSYDYSAEEQSTNCRLHQTLQAITMDLRSERKQEVDTSKQDVAGISDQQPVYAEIEPYSRIDLDESCFPTSAAGAVIPAPNCEVPLHLQDALRTEQLKFETERTLELAPTSSGLPWASNGWDRIAHSGVTTAMPLSEVSLHWKVYVDGPFATSCSSILRTEHAVLVAGGVGVTPHAATLEALLEDMRRSTRICPCGCEEKVFFDQQLAVKQMDFIWLTKDRSSWEWFMPLFRDLEKEQESLGMKRPIARLRLYLTSAGAANDLRATFLQLALRAAHRRDGRDAISGLRERTRTGRPKWRKVLQKLKDCRRGRIKVFCCGPTSLSDELRLHCHELGIECASESF